MFIQRCHFCDAGCLRDSTFILVACQQNNCSFIWIIITRRSNKTVHCSSRYQFILEYEQYRYSAFQEKIDERNLAGENTLKSISYHSGTKANLEVALSIDQLNCVSTNTLMMCTCMLTQLHLRVPHHTCNFLFYYQKCLIITTFIWTSERIFHCINVQSIQTDDTSKKNRSQWAEKHCKQHSKKSTGVSYW